jgi:hypothetical protein
MTTLKYHMLTFNLYCICIGIICAIYNIYGRVFLAIALIPWLDPDCDQSTSWHRWFFSHSIIPGLIESWCWTAILPNEYWLMLVIVFCSYEVIHLIGDLGSSKGFGSIKLKPFDKTLNARWWIFFNIIVFLSIVIILMEI